MNEHEVPVQAGRVDGRDQHAAADRAEQVEKLADETRQRHERLRQTVSGLQESLDYLRLSIKYWSRPGGDPPEENGYLRKMLEEKTGDGVGWLSGLGALRLSW